MPSTWFCIHITSASPGQLAAFWSAAIGYPIVFEGPQGEVAIAQDKHTHPGMMFYPAHEPLAGKGRIHVELNPDDQEAEVDRLIGLGAKRVDIGQPDDASWVVLADPEGNEFCVLAPWRLPQDG